METPWEDKPINFFGRVTEHEFFDISTGNKLGDITFSTRAYNRRISLMMRHIRVDGTNDAAYCGRYAEEKGQTAWLKRCADLRTTKAKANTKRRAHKRPKKGSEKTTFSAQP